MSTNKEKEFSIEKQFLAADLEDSLIIQEQTKLDNFKPKIVWRNVFLFTILHLAALQGFWHFLFNANWLTFIWTIFLWIFSGMGITAGAHRLWAHRSYKARFPLRTLLMILNCIAFQNDIIEWARDHRCHHKWSDTDADPHNVNRGLFFAHMGWLLVKKHPQVKAKGAGLDLSDLFDDPVLRFQRKYYLLLVFIFCFFNADSNSRLFLGEKPLTAFLTGAAFRFGYRPYDVNISPAESVWTTILAVGEGGHNYHHTFPQDYRTSEMMTPFNLTKAFIDFFAIIGQAYERKVTPISNIYRQMGRQLEQLHKRVMDSHKSF
uniref:Uncharacterized protein n=1 Tax=Meloidogyne enterolobii TaxID=390850 RepID=A0A6V7WMI0_MELEN|nr:unnamed protein product [Meloidogyne enterolobii]